MTNKTYDILKYIVTTEEKEPPTKTRYRKKYITSGDDNLYIKFHIYYGNYEEKKSITIGGEKTVNFTWSIFLDKVFDGNCFSKFLNSTISISYSKSDISGLSSL